MIFNAGIFEITQDLKLYFYLLAQTFQTRCNPAYYNSSEYSAGCGFIWSPKMAFTHFELWAI